MEMVAVSGAKDFSNGLQLRQEGIVPRHFALPDYEFLIPAAGRVFSCRTVSWSETRER